MKYDCGIQEEVQNCVHCLQQILNGNMLVKMSIVIISKGSYTRSRGNVFHMDQEQRGHRERKHCPRDSCRICEKSKINANE